ncbi:hypothetical protein PROFUN_07425 [Planoprotostelium fungivorum]|uniref:BTB domain-containing protein n=1 Tax=Planoprotostelium fungivorum TaxID=1890364 RepID=A0A2P6NLD1_9EUKA|nr:hypothetical protein PROFUN_07425 [Planoprotostelium fungivorum]
MPEHSLSNDLQIIACIIAALSTILNFQALLQRDKIAMTLKTAGPIGLRRLHNGISSSGHTDIWTAAREGDLERVKYLVEVEDVDVNKTNEYDAIPMFYACLCGHKEVLEYLLQHGATADAETFEGWRCYYACLNAEIQGVLKEYKANPRDFNRLVEDFRKMFQQAQEVGFDQVGTCFPDVCFIMEGNKRIYAHRFVLAASSKYFSEHLSGRWAGKREIRMRSHDIQGFQPFAPFEAIVTWLYTHSVSIDVEHLPSFLLMCKNFQLDDLLLMAETELGLSRYRDLSTLDYYYQVETYLSEDRVMRNRRRFILSPRDPTLNRNMYRLFRKITLAPETRDIFPDFTVQIARTEEDEKDRPMMKIIPSHRSLLCSRSAFFRPIIEGKFDNSTEVIQLCKTDPLPQAVLEMVMEYLYTNDIRKIRDSDLLVDVMEASNLFLLPDLKRLCASVMMENIDLSNVYDAIKVSELYESERLKEHCFQVLAASWDEVVLTNELNRFVSTSSVQTVQAFREELEDWLVHQEQTEKWLKIEEDWDQIFTKSTSQAS